MEAGPLSVKKIFGQERRLTVPLFQRPYVWEQKAQLQPFWDDIRTVAERLAAGKPARIHFLGAIVLDHVPKPMGHVEVRQVIDGQQRLTTIQLFFEAFADLCKENGATTHHKALLKLTRNEDPMSTDPDEQFKVWPTTVDQEHFRKVMQCEGRTELLKLYQVKKREVKKSRAKAGAKNKRKPKEGQTTLGNSIADAYHFFYGAISLWLAPNTAGYEKRMDVLFETLREYVWMVVIDLNKDDDAQVIFETLNARGTPLLPADLVKNLLFHGAQLANEDIDSLYGKFWKSFDQDDTYWRRKQGRGRSQRAKIDMFLQHYLTVKLRDEIPAAHLYVAFRDHAATSKPSEALADIHRYAEVYRSFDKLAAGTREALFVERIGALDLTTAYPLLLELLMKHAQDMDQVRSILTDIESFLVRRMVCQLNTRGYSRLFIDLLVAVGGKGGSVQSRVREVLLSSEADSGRWPDDAEIKKVWLQEPMFGKQPKKRVRMLLEALERASRTGKSEQLTFDEKLTIEHLMPQKWEKHWPLPDADDTEEKPSERRNRIIHTIGNLTLLTKKLNPSVSNGPWLKKRDMIAEHSLLKLNKTLTLANWNEKTIGTRGQTLLALALTIWPRPE